MRMSFLQTGYEDEDEQRRAVDVRSLDAHPQAAREHEGPEGCGGAGGAQAARKAKGLRGDLTDKGRIL